MTITQPDIRLKKNGAAWAQKAAAQTLAHEENGWYEVTLDATDTDTIGHLLVAIHESGALPVWQEYHVLAANVYDSLFGAATDKLDVNVEEWNTTTVPAEHTAGFPVVTIKDGTGTGEINTNAGAVALVDLVTTTTTATNVTTVNGLAAGVITATSIATGAIDADAIALDAVNEITGSVAGTADSGSTTTVVDTERTEADTDYWKGSLITFTSGTLLGQTRLITAFNAGTDTITFAPATTVAVGTHTYRILPAGRADLHFWLGSIVNALVSGRVDASVGAMAADVITAAAIANGAIDAATFAAGAIDAAAIANGAIDAATFAAGAIDAAAIATGAIDADALAADAVDEIWAKTMTELSAVPAINASTLAALSWVFTLARNKIQQTSSVQTIFKDDTTTTLATAGVSDDATTFQRNEFV